MQKSASRMARDLHRVLPDMAKKVRGNYLRNKSPEQRDALIRDKMLPQKIRERAQRIRNTYKSFLQTEKESENLVRGIERLKKLLDEVDLHHQKTEATEKWLENSLSEDDYLKKRNRLKNSAKIVLENCKEKIQKLKFFENNLPKAGAHFVKEYRETLEKNYKELRERITEIEE